MTGELPAMPNSCPSADACPVRITLKVAESQVNLLGQKPDVLLSKQKSLGGIRLTRQILDAVVSEHGCPGEQTGSNEQRVCPLLDIVMATRTYVVTGWGPHIQVDLERLGQSAVPDDSEANHPGLYL